MFEAAAKEIYDILKQEGVADMPIGIDVVEPPFLFALQKLGLKVMDGQQVMLDAREIKSYDEITLLNTAAAMGDGVYQDIFEALKPGIRENEVVAMAASVFMSVWKSATPSPICACWSIEATTQRWSA